MLHCCTSTAKRGIKPTMERSLMGSLVRSVHRKNESAQIPFELSLQDSVVILSWSILRFQDLPSSTLSCHPDWPAHRSRTGDSRCQLFESNSSKINSMLILTALQMHYGNITTCCTSSVGSQSPCSALFATRVMAWNWQRQPRQEWCFQTSEAHYYIIELSCIYLSFHKYSHCSSMILSLLMLRSCPVQWARNVQQTCRRCFRTWGKSSKITWDPLPKLVNFETWEIEMLCAHRVVECQLQSHSHQCQALAFQPMARQVKERVFWSFTIERCSRSKL